MHRQRRDHMHQIRTVLIKTGLCPHSSQGRYPGERHWEPRGSNLTSVAWSANVGSRLTRNASCSEAQARTSERAEIRKDMEKTNIRSRPTHDEVDVLLSESESLEQVRREAPALPQKRVPHEKMRTRAASQMQHINSAEVAVEMSRSKRHETKVTSPRRQTLYRRLRNKGRGEIVARED